MKSDRALRQNQTFQEERSKLTKIKYKILSLELIYENEKLKHELDQRDFENGKLNEAISRLNFYENPGIAFTLEQKYLLENKIREVEKENRSLIEEKSKIDVEYKITNERYSELKRKFEELKSEVSIGKTRDSDTINSLEFKLNQLKETYDIIKAENKIFKTSDEKQKFELLNLRNEKEKLEDKYSKAKLTKDELSKKVALLENQITSLNYEKEYSLMEKRKNEEEKRIRQEMKNQYIDQMKNSISNFKSEIMRSRSRSKGHN